MKERRRLSHAIRRYLVLAVIPCTFPNTFSKHSQATLSKHFPILIFRQLIRVKSVCSRKPIPPGHLYLLHNIFTLLSHEPKAISRKEKAEVCSTSNLGPCSMKTNVKSSRSRTHDSFLGAEGAATPTGGFRLGIFNGKP